MRTRFVTAFVCSSWASLAAGCTGSIADTPGAGAMGASGAPSSTGSGGGTSVPGGTGGTSTTSTGGGSGTPTGNGGAATGSSGGAAGATTPAGGDLPYVAPSAAPAALPARVWRLSHAEYQRSVKAFLGIDVDVADFPGDIDSGIYANMSGTNFVRVDSATAYGETAATLTNGLSSAQLNALIPCGNTAASCKDDFLKSVIAKAFRRPVQAEDTTRYAAVFDAAVPSGDAALPYRSVLRALLSSPFFLYRTEVGDLAQPASPSFKLTGHEVASFLSYSILGTPPSAELLAAAARGDLGNTATLTTALAPLLDQPNATTQLATFLFQWIKLQNFADVTKFEASFPGFATIREPMLNEARTFFTQNGMKGTLTALLTAPVPASGALDQFYRSDVSAPAGAQHTGILGLGATLSLYGKAERSSPTLRGMFVRERLLCQHISLPPTIVPDISDTAERASPTTTRELYEMHAADPLCASCHRMLDPIGFTLEQLDGAGRFRSKENGVALNSSGNLINTDVNGTYTTQAELAAALSRSDWVRECVATQAFRFYFGQSEEKRGLPPVMAGFRALQQSGTMRDLLLSLLSSPSSLERTRG